MATTSRFTRWASRPSWPPFGSSSACCFNGEPSDQRRVPVLRRDTRGARPFDCQQVKDCCVGSRTCKKPLCWLPAGRLRFLGDDTSPGVIIERTVSGPAPVTNGLYRRELAYLGSAPNQENIAAVDVIGGDERRQQRELEQSHLFLLLKDFSAPRFCGQIELAFGADRAAVGDLNGQL
jgi:hypothetical protein